ncbi:MAG: Rrf2 family transcriptional regulator [Pseudomonadota bacterium]
MRLTKQTAYAIRILTHCAMAGDGPVTTRAIARAHHITDFNVAKIVPMLVGAGFLTSTRGRSGGLKLAKPARDIVLGDVVRATEATRMQADCVGPDVECAIRPLAPVNRILDEAWSAFIGVLDDYTLADLTEHRPRGRADGLLGALTH